MAMIFTETWNSYIDTAGLSKRYATVATPWTWQASAGKFGGPCVVADNTAGVATAALITRNTAISPPQTDLFLGFWMKLSSAPASTTDIVHLVNKSGTLLWNLRLLTDGTMSLFDGSFTRAVAQAFLPDDEWHWLEISVNSGLFYMDDELQWSSSGISNNDAFTSLRFTVPIGVSMSVGDVIIYNNDAGYPQEANQPFGPVLTATMRPAADLVVQFDPGTHNAGQVNEVALDLATSVLCQSDDVGFQDLYDYDATFPASPDPVRIHTAMLTSYVFDPDIGKVNFNHICQSGSAQATATARATPIELDGRYLQDSFPNDPETATTWVAARLNDAKFGIRNDGP